MLTKRREPLILLDYSQPSSVNETINTLTLNELFSSDILNIIRAHFFKYRHVTLMTYDVRLLRKPFNKGLMLLLMGRGCGKIVDSKGITIHLGGMLLFSWALRGLLEMITGHLYVRIILPGRISNLSSTKKQAHSVVKSSSPLYLRTDMVFGVTAGGSIAHISGVANCFKSIYGHLDFFSTDHIPSISRDIEQNIIEIDRKYSDSPNIKEMLYSFYIARYVSRKLTSSPKFIYQRYSLCNFSGVLLANEYHCPFVLEYNGSEIWIAKNWGGQYKNYDMASKIEQLDLHRADLVVTVSEALKVTLIDSGIPESKILVNPNGVDVELYSSDVDCSAVRDSHLLDDCFVFGFIGTFGDWHGVMILIQAFHQLVCTLPNERGHLRLMMIGEGKLFPEAEKYIAENDLEDCCILTGTVPQAEGPRYLSACDVLVSPHVQNSDGSEFFGSPTKLFEYMAMEKPIIASDLAQIGDVLDESVAILVTPGDVEQLARAMKRTCENRSKFSVLAKKARERVIALYTWEAHTQRIVDRITMLERVKDD